MRTHALVLIVGCVVGAVAGGATTIALRGGTPGYFGLGRALGVPRTSTMPTSHSDAFVIVDWDVDGDNDIVELFTAPINEAFVRFWDNDGAGNFTPESITPLRDIFPPPPEATPPRVQIDWNYDLSSPLSERMQAADLNADGIPELVLFTADLQWLVNGSYALGIQGPLVIPNALASWQPSPSRRADVNADGVVNAADLAGVLGAWGQVIPDAPQRR